MVRRQHCRVAEQQIRTLVYTAALPTGAVYFGRTHFSAPCASKYKALDACKCGRHTAQPAPFHVACLSSSKDRRYRFTQAEAPDMPT